jgi:glycosyltransferase involved in cell wall biosynthesis
LEHQVKLRIIGIPDKNGLSLPSAIRDRVECLPYIPIRRLMEEISRAKFMVLPLPYYRYSFGQMTLLQAMSLQKAVIVSRVPGVADYVRDGQNAVWYEPGDWRELKNKMDELLTDPALTEKIARNARTTIQQEFNERNLATNLYQAIHRLC